MTLHVNSSGLKKVKDLYVAGQKIREAHIWDGTAWKKVFSSVTFGNGTLTKVGNQTIAVSAFTVIQPWSVSGQLIVESGGIRVPQGVSITINASLQFVGTGQASAQQLIRLMNGTTELGRANRGSYNSSPVKLSRTLVGTGELLTMQGSTNQTGSSREIVNETGTSMQITLN